MKVSDHDIDLTQLTSGQTDQFDRIEKLWPEFGHSLQVIAATEGGMGWRTVDGVEYLTRYTQVDGKKQSRSLGRRSPETEAQMEHFENTVLKARRIRREKREEVLLTCKVAKAHGIARLHRTFADALDWLWYTDANKRVALFGGTALLAYESGSRTLAPAPLVKEPHLQFIAHSEDPELMGLPEIGEACGAGETGRVRFENDRFVIRDDDDRTVAEIFKPSFFLDRLDDDQAQDMRIELETPGLRAMTFSRDHRPIELCVPDPRIYAIAARCLGADGDVWEQRAAFSTEMVRRRWPDKFTGRQEDLLEGLEHADGHMRFRGP